MEWITDNALALWGAVAATVAALAALSGARAAHRQAWLLERRKDPTIACADATWVSRQPGWLFIMLRIANLEEVTLQLEEVVVHGPRGQAVLTEHEAHEDRGHLGPEIRDPLPVQGYVRRRVPLRVAIAPRSAAPSQMYAGGNGSVQFIRLYIHLPTSRWSLRSSTFLSIECSLSWMDRADRPFKMPVQIRLPAQTVSATA